MVEWIAVIISICSLAIAIHCKIQQRKSEKRIKNKERLRNFVEELKFIINTINITITDIKDPMKNGDLRFQLTLLGKDAASKMFNEKNDVVIINVEAIYKKKFGDIEKKIVIEKEDIEPLEKGILITVSCYIQKDMDYVIYLPFFTILFHRLDNLEREYKDILIDYSPELTKNLKSYIKEIYLLIQRSIINSKKIEVRVSQFNKSDEIALFVYNKIIGKEELNSYLDKMEKDKMNIEKLKENLINICYY